MMCTQNSNHDKTVREFQLKSKSMESNNFSPNNLLLMIAIMVKYFDFVLS